MSELCDPHRRVHPAQCVLDHQFLFCFTEDEADGWLISGVLEKVIHRGEVEIHFAGVLRLEGATLQVDDDEATKLQVVEQKVKAIVFARNLQRVLAANEGKPCAEFQQETCGCAPPIQPRFPFRGRSWSR